MDLGAGILEGTEIYCSIFCDSYSGQPGLRKCGQEDPEVRLGAVTYCRLLWEECASGLTGQKIRQDVLHLHGDVLHLQLLLFQSPLYAEKNE